MTARTTEELFKGRVNCYETYICQCWELDGFEKELQINEAVKSSTGYFSAGYIARVTGLDICGIEDILSDKTKFRKSFLKGEKGQDIYLVNTPFSYLKDLWNSFKHMNYLKYYKRMKNDRN